MFLILLVIVASTGILQHVLHRSGYDAAANIAYVVHLMAVVPMLVLEVPFSKWSHLAYRPLAMYFADVRAEPRSPPCVSANWPTCRRRARRRPRERRTSMDEPKIGVYVCNCGTNIAKMVDCDAIVEAASQLPGVTVAKAYKYMCSNPGQEMIVQDMKEHGLDRVVVAACSPRMHEPTFRKALADRGRQPVLPRDGQHPRAVQLGARRPRARPPTRPRR